MLVCTKDLNGFKRYLFRKLMLGYTESSEPNQAVYFRNLMIGYTKEMNGIRRYLCRKLMLV